MTNSITEVVEENILSKSEIELHMRRIETNGEKKNIFFLNSVFALDFFFFFAALVVVR